MKLIERRENAGIVTCVYGSTGVRGVKSAAGRIVRAAALEGFEAKYIALRDLERGADEGNASLELRPDAGQREIIDALSARNCDRLYLSGSFFGARVGVGVDLRTYEVLITVPADRADLAGKLADELSAKRSRQ